MRNDLLWTAVAAIASLTLSGCGDAGVVEAVARVGDARPAVPAAAEAVPRAAPMPPMAPRALPMPQHPAGGAALDLFREDLDPSHMAVASYSD